MDANEWMSTFKQGLENANEFQGKNFTTDLSQIFTDERLFNADGSPKYNTNWQDEASRTAISHNHQISIQRTGEGIFYRSIHQLYRSTGYFVEFLLQTYQCKIGV